MLYGASDCMSLSLDLPSEMQPVTVVGARLLH